MRSFLFVTTLSAIVGIVQELTYWLSGILLTGTIPGSSLKLFFEDLSIGRIFRVTAFFSSPSRLASTLMVVIAVSVYFLMSIWKKRGNEKILLAGSILLMTAALLLTFARATILGLLFALFLMPFFRKSRLSLHYGAFLVLLVVLFWTSGMADYAVRKIFVGDVGYRVKLMESSMAGVLKENTIIGVGVGRGYVYHPNIKNWPVHNAFMLTWVETGLLGFIVYCGIFVLLFTRLFHAIAESTREEDATFLKAVLLGFVSLVIYINGDPSPYDSFVWMYFGLIESAIAACRKGAPSPASSNDRGAKGGDWVPVDGGRAATTP